MELTSVKSIKLIDFTKVKAWLYKVMIALIDARQQEANRRIAMMHLSVMTDRELHDIGIGRGDIKRVVYEK